MSSQPQLTSQSFSSDLVAFGVVPTKSSAYNARQDTYDQLDDGYGCCPQEILNLLEGMLTRKSNLVLDGFESPWGWLQNFVQALYDNDVCDENGHAYENYDGWAEEIFSTVLPEPVWDDVLFRYEDEYQPNGYVIRDLLHVCFSTFAKPTISEYLREARAGNSMLIQVIEDNLVQDMLDINHNVVYNLQKLHGLTSKNPPFYEYIIQTYGKKPALELSSLQLLTICRWYQYRLPTQQQLAAQHR